MTATPVAEWTAELSIRADIAETRRAARWLRVSGEAGGVPEECVTRLDHCMEEALANVVAHGGPGARAADIAIRLEVRCDAGMSAAVLNISDAGCAFDPTRAPVPARPGSLAEARPGGLGIQMMRSYADRIGYARTAERNHLAFMVTW